jgi:hypothetical protein
VKGGVKFLLDLDCGLGCGDLTRLMPMMNVPAMLDHPARWQARTDCRAAVRRCGSWGLRRRAPVLLHSESLNGIAHGLQWVAPAVCQRRAA